MMLATFIFGLACAAGAALLVRGWRGGRTDDHPICRACGFDLFGLPAGTSRCSECGADLTRPRATRIGHRARRPALIGFGAAVLFACATVGGAYGWAQLRDVDANTWKPLRWLVSETKPNNTPAVRSAAFAELMRRLTASELDVDDANFIADAGLAHQADLATPFMPEWGEFIQAAHAAKLLSTGRWQRYARQAGEFSLDLRPKVRRGDPLPMRVKHATPRTTISRTFGYLWQNVRVISVRIDDVYDRDVPPALLAQTNLAVYGDGVWKEPLSADTLAKLRDGKHTARVTIEVTLHYSAPDTTWEPMILSYRAEVESEWELVPAGVETVKLIPPSPDSAPPQFEVSYAGYHRTGELIVGLRVRPATEPLAYAVLARAGAREFELGTFVGGPYVETRQWLSAKIPDFSGDRVDLILRPSPEAAHRTVDVVEALKEEIEIVDVRIARPLTMPTTNP